MSATVAHAEDMRRRTEPQRGGHKEEAEATQPHTTRHSVKGRTQSLFAGQKGLPCRTATNGEEQQQLSRSLCWVPALPALSVLGPGALPVLSASGPGALWAGTWHPLSLSVSGPGALCVGPCCSLCRVPALSRSCRGPAPCRAFQIPILHNFQSHYFIEESRNNYVRTCSGCQQ